MINLNDKSQPFTCSGGGPVLVIPAELASQWHGANAPPGVEIPPGWTWGKRGGPVCDYDRACDPSPLERSEYGGFGWVEVSGKPALVLDGEIVTTFVKDGDGGYVVRNSVGEDASEDPNAIADDRWRVIGPSTLSLTDGRLFMFDSAFRGAADPAEITAHDGVGVIELGEGQWEIAFATSKDGVDFVRLRRARVEPA